MNGFIDADTHVVESAEVWEFMDKDMYDRRPILLKAPSDTEYQSSNAFWLIDGQIFPKSVGKGSARLSTPAEQDRQWQPAGHRPGGAAVDRPGGPGAGPGQARRGRGSDLLDPVGRPPHP